MLQDVANPVLLATLQACRLIHPPGPFEPVKTVDFLCFLILISIDIGWLPLFLLFYPHGLLLTLALLSYIASSTYKS